MKVSDLTTGDSERRAAEDALVQTETTDTVNSGLVGSADKSGSMLKDDLFERHTRDFSSSEASPGKSADAVSAGEGGSGIESALKDSGSTGTSVDSSKLSRGLKAARKAALASGIHKTLEDTEFEGVDDAYYKGKTSYKLTKKGVNKLRERSAKKAAEKAGGKGLGALNEKKYRRPKGQEELQRELQRKRNQFTSRALQAEKAAQASSAAGATGGSKSIAVITAKSGGGGAAAAAGAGGCLVPVVVVFLVFLLLVTIIGGLLGNNDDDVGSLTGNEAIIAQYLLDQGFSKASVAGILGNIANEGDPSSDVNLSGMFNYRYEYACGMFQYTHASNVVDKSYSHSCEYCRYKRWCSENGKNWADLNTQMEWTFGGAGGGWEDRWVMRKTYYVGYWGQRYSWLTRSTLCEASEYKDLTDPAIAAYCWMAGYEGPATGETAHLDRRIESAQKYFEMLNSGGGSGQTYASSSGTARAIADWCYRTPSTSSGYCAMWVSRVYQNATGTYPGGNANDMYFTYCVSSDRSELKVGMIIASGPHVGHTGRYRNGSGGTTAYGHVGIYVGDNKVMHSTGGSVHTDSLDDWIASYTVKDVSCGETMTVKWGYPNWV